MSLSAINNVNLAEQNYSTEFKGASPAKTISKANCEPLCDTVSFSGKQNVEEASEQAPKKKASVGKKIGVGIASYFVPGLGQLINGQPKKAVGFLAGSLASIGLTVACPPLGIAAALGVGIGGIVDAVKNA